MGDCDLTSRPPRLLNIVPGRWGEAFSNWLADQPDEFRAGPDHVAMDAFAGYKKAATDVLPEATTVMDPFHVVALVGTKLDETRRRLQTEILGRRGRPRHDRRLRCDAEEGQNDHDQAHRHAGVNDPGRAEGATQPADEDGTGTFPLQRDITR